MVEPNTHQRRGLVDDDEDDDRDHVEDGMDAYSPLSEVDPSHASTSRLPPPSSQAVPVPPPSAPPSSWLEQTLFFTCGVGTSIGYIATLSSLVYFKILYGATSFPLLNLAIYLPLLPISVAQAVWDQDYDVKYTSRNTFLVRGVVGYFLGMVGTYRMITSHRLASVVINALLQGTGGAILYGTLNQLASVTATTRTTTATLLMVSVEEKKSGGQLQTALSAGVQASALVVLVLDILTGFGVHQGTQFSTFIKSIVLIEVLCLITFLWLLRARPLVMAAMVGRDSSLQIESSRAMEQHHYHVVEDGDGDGDGDDAELERPLMPNTGRQEEGSSTEPFSFAELWSRTNECCWILALTLIPSFLVGSWFTQVQTDWAALASWLFYVRIGADFIGRLATIVLPPRTLTCLQHTGAVRILLVAAFFFNAHHSFPVRGRQADVLSIVVVAIISFLSGYLVTAGYQLAPLSLESDRRAANAAQQASLLTVAFAVSAVVGLLSSFALMALGV